MAKEVMASGIGIDVTSKKIAILLYADDIVIITDNPKDLKKGLKIATEFGKKWRCKYNAKKTQVVLFGKNKNKKHNWKIGTNEIKQVESYKYLGIEIENKMKWKLFKKRLLDKSERNMRAAMGMGTRTKHLSVKAAVGIWKAVVRPVLEYAAEIWGDKDWKEAEILQRTMAKRILGMKERASNEAVLGDLGWWPLKARRDMIRLRYWHKLLSMDNTRLPRLVYEWELKNEDRNNCWAKYTKKLLLDLEIDYYWLKQEIDKNREQWNKLIHDKIQEREQKEWRQRALLKPKLRTYVKYKLILEEEKYLKNEDAIGRRMLARIRSGTNNLRIETGRYERPKLPEEYRICQVCMEGTENEEHFLFHCKAYSKIREDLALDTELVQRKDKTRNMLFGVGTANETNEAIRLLGEQWQEETEY